MQIEGGKVRIKVFEGGSMKGRGLFRDIDWFLETASAALTAKSDWCCDVVALAYEINHSYFTVYT